MTGLFDSLSEERLDRDTRERALAWLLERHPEAPVAAFEAKGIFVEMPDSIPLRDNQVMAGRSGLDSVINNEEAFINMALRWERMLVTGAGHCIVPREGLSTVTCYWVDLRDVHDVILAVIVGVSDEELADTSEESRTIATPPPRFASMKKDERGMVKEVDEAFTKILGWESAEIAGKRSLDLLHPDDAQLAVENWIEMMTRPGPARRVRQRMQHKDGHWLWFEVTNHNLLADPEYGCVVGEMVDISEEMATQEALRAREQLLDRLTAALPVGVFQIDTESKVVFTNDRLHAILGVQPAEEIEAQLATVSDDDRLRLTETIGAVLREGSNADVEVGVLLPETADLRNCTISLRALSHEDGTISGAIACVADVTDSARMQAELKRRATYDELTGCHNRASVVAALEDSIAGGRGKAERAVMFVDLDGFKEVNDQNGHAAGDELLREVAARLLEAVRDTDLVGRIGGDEFLVVCPDIGGIEAAMKLAERIARAIGDEDVDAGGHRFDCQVSIGVAWSAGAAMSADTLVAMADRAMYESKHARAGRPRLARELQQSSGPHT
jgi:diguanylate cyclase (GGDEF)-like protein/PAS domain S-box-containing protein